MKTRNAGWLGLLILAALAASAGGETPEGLTKEVRASLDRDGFCITSQNYGMGGTYLECGQKVPPFISADSVLAKFHWLMRETMLRRDAALAKMLKKDLKIICESLDHMAVGEPGADPEVCKAAMARAKIVCGTALRLLDPTWRAADADAGREIEAEASRVEAAKEKTKPSWLGPVEPCFTAIDYTSCKPLGLHGDSEGEGRYFRAVRFLQMVPFRLARKVELYSACYILQAAHAARKDMDNVKVPAPFLKQALPRKEINDERVWQLRLSGHFLALSEGGGVFHYIYLENTRIGRSGIPFSGSLLMRMPDDAPPLRGMLRDSMAYDDSDGTYQPASINNLISTMPMPESERDSRMIAPLAPPDSIIFQRVMDSMTAKGMEDMAPDPLLAAAWFGDKQAMTQMDLRYPGCGKLFSVPKPVITLEAIPEMRDRIPLFEAYYEALRSLLARPDPGVPDFMRRNAWHLKTRQTVLASWSRMRNCFALEASGSLGVGGGPMDCPGFVEPCPEFYQRLSRIDGDMTELCLDYAGNDTDRAVFVWKEFALLCARLEGMAHKQLRGIEPNSLDRKFYGEYAFQLLNQCDDTPRAAVVARTGLTGKTLIVAAGPNRVLWVKYPWKGKTYLCRGGVMSFYSFTAPEPITDAEWQNRLEAKPPPKPPEWLDPLAMSESRP